MNCENYPAGTLRRNVPGKEILIAWPKDPLYSTVTMVANEYWDVDSGSWRAIQDNEEDNQPEAPESLVKEEDQQNKKGSV